MSGNSRSRQKPKLEPISLEELAGTTGMSGFGTLFTRDLSQSVPVLDRLDESSAPETSAVEPTAVEIAAPVFESSALPIAAVDRGAEESSALDLDSTAVLSTAIETTAVETSAPDWPGYRRPKIRRADTVQDGHSLAEQSVYEIMYREGKPFQGDSRILTTGLRTLAERVRLAYANCKANVRSLIGKQAIEEYGEGFSYTTGRTYLIYSPAEVLRRRRAAGLTHVIRTRGVAFVHPETGAPIECTRNERA